VKLHLPIALRARLKSNPLLRRAWSTGRFAARSLRNRAVDPADVLAARANDIPGTLKIELTNVCNANCTFCGYQYEERPQGLMPDDLYRSALEQYRAMGGTDLSFTPVVGEPLLDKRFVERIELARELGYEKIFTYTNGILLEKHDLRRLLTSGIERLQVSTAGFDEAEYERVFRSKRYRKMLRGLRKLLELNDQLGRPVRIRIELRSDTPMSEIRRRTDYIENVKPFIDEEQDLGCLVEYDTWGGMIREEDLTGIMRVAKIPRYKRTPCFRTYSCMVMWDGQVRACSCRFSNEDPIDALLIGNLNGASLKEIWFGERLASLRRSFVEERLPGVCRSCTMYEVATYPGLRF
jgi:MoaA/NifB/PqqE/SkfB family radical SAM enzyme